jgi:hypothetical protein
MFPVLRVKWVGVGVGLGCGWTLTKVSKTFGLPERGPSWQLYRFCVKGLRCCKYCLPNAVSAHLIFIL